MERIEQNLEMPAAAEIGDPHQGLDVGEPKVTPMSNGVSNPHQIIFTHATLHSTIST